jgi:dCMP deaminase
MTADRWDMYFMDIARRTAQQSKDPSTQVGAVIVSPRRRIVSTGFNGFAAGVRDLKERLETREIKYKMVIHAELNAILAARADLEDHILYCTHQPCAHCASVIIQSGIKKVVAPPASEELHSRWAADFALTEELFFEANVRCRWPMEL